VSEASTLQNALVPQGIRAAVPSDLEAVEALLKPLADKGVLAPRSREQLGAELQHYTLLERDGRVRRFRVRV
jgi:N-acetylglutamate synthase-like GNAT family acetyltransferase